MSIKENAKISSIKSIRVELNKSIELMNNLIKEDALLASNITGYKDRIREIVA